MKKILLFLMPYVLYTQDIPQVPQQTRCVDCLFATQIDNLTVFINDPGVYCVIQDVQVPTGRIAGFVIQADDVLLDLNGHIITGVFQNVSTIGVNINGIGIIIRPLNNIAPRNITIRNGTIAFMRITGISATSASSVTLENITFLANNVGITANNINGGFINNCLFALSTSNAVQFNNLNGTVSQNIKMVNCKAINNGGNGFSLGANCLNFIMQDLISNNNGLNGYLQVASDRADYISCYANSNGQIGFSIAGNNNSIEQCQAKGNALQGFQLTGNNMFVSDSLALQNLGTGFLLAAPSAQAQFRSNTATTNAIGFQNNGNANNRFYANFANNNGTVVANNFVNIPNVTISPTPVTPINFTSNIAN